MKNKLIKLGSVIAIAAPAGVIACSCSDKKAPALPGLPALPGTGDTHHIVTQPEITTEMQKITQVDLTGLGNLKTLAPGDLERVVKTKLQEAVDNNTMLQDNKTKVMSNMKFRLASDGKMLVRYSAMGTVNPAGYSTAEMIHLDVSALSKAAKEVMLTLQSTDKTALYNQLNSTVYADDSPVSVIEFADSAETHELVAYGGKWNYFDASAGTIVEATFPATQSALDFATQTFLEKITDSASAYIMAQYPAGGSVHEEKISLTPWSATWS